MSETLSNYHVWGCPTYVLEPKFQKPGVKTLKWYPRGRRRVNTGSIKMSSTQVGMVLKRLNFSVPLQYHVLFMTYFLLWQLAQKKIHKSG